MSLFETATTAIFNSPMAVVATHTDESGLETPCRVIISREQEILGQYAQTLERITLIRLQSQQIQAQTGDTITIAAGTHQGTWILRDRLYDDGLTQQFEAIPEE